MTPSVLTRDPKGPDARVVVVALTVVVVAGEVVVTSDGVVVSGVVVLVDDVDEITEVGLVEVVVSTWSLPQAARNTIRRVAVLLSLFLLCFIDPPRCFGPDLYQTLSTLSGVSYGLEPYQDSQ